MREEIKSTPHPRQSRRGFTLIELLIVTSITALLFSIGVAFYQDFNRSQIVEQEAKKLKENLRLAQSKALAGEKPEGCDGLSGWRIYFPDNTSYILQAICPDPVSFRTINLSPNLSKTSGPSVVFFKVLGQGVEGGGKIVISGFGKTSWVEIDAGGNIK